DPSETTITIARAILLRAMEKPVTRRSALLSGARRQAGGSLTKIAGLAAICTSAIMLQPHAPLGLPGHRALGWLSLLLVMRLVGGVSIRGIWVSLGSVGASGWVRLLGSDLGFGAGAGVIGYSVAWVLDRQWRRLAARFGIETGP